MIRGRHFDKGKEKALSIEKNNILLTKITDKVPAIIFINEVGKNGDFRSVRNIWTNKEGLDLTGYTQHEITQSGYRLFEEILHPDDLELLPMTIEMANNREKDQNYVLLLRLKAKDKKKYNWFYCRGRIIEHFPDGGPKIYLNIALEITDQMHTENQLTAALKEISKLKNELRFKSLTKREKEVLACIANGLTDKEISKKLSISVATAKTHRNNLIKKLKLKNTASLAVFATECGLN